MSLFTWSLVEMVKDKNKIVNYSYKKNETKKVMLSLPKMNQEFICLEFNRMAT